jgi:hypothetical protein
VAAFEFCVATWVPNSMCSGVAETLVGWHVGVVERISVEVDEALSLFLGDVEMSVHVDEMLEPS